LPRSLISSCLVLARKEKKRKRGNATALDLLFIPLLSKDPDSPAKKYVVRGENGQEKKRKRKVLVLFSWCGTSVRTRGDGREGKKEGKGGRGPFARLLLSIHHLE